MSVAYLEKFRMVASCDSSIHVWDPWCGGRLLSSMNGIPVNILKCLPTPHPNILAASTQPTLHSIDPRNGKSVAELKVRTTILYKFVCHNLIITHFRYLSMPLAS